jgi:uncharacterized membrane protein
MGKTRMEAFSDGVLAIIITIMVLELKVPEGHGHDFEALKPLTPVFLAYVLSFVYVGIYWNNHHHLLHTVHHVTGGILWANLHLLFWLSLFPFTTAWTGESSGASIPTAVYGAVLFMAAIAYYMLQKTIMAATGGQGVLSEALGRDWKGKLSPVIYLAAIVVAFWYPWIANSLYALVALTWIVPDRRIERAISEHNGSK